MCLTKYVISKGKKPFQNTIQSDTKAIALLAIKN